MAKIYSANLSLQDAYKLEHLMKICQSKSFGAWVRERLAAAEKNGAFDEIQVIEKVTIPALTPKERPKSVPESQPDDVPKMVAEMHTSGEEPPRPVKKVIHPPIEPGEAALDMMIQHDPDLEGLE